MRIETTLTRHRHCKTSAIKVSIALLFILKGNTLAINGNMGDGSGSRDNPYLIEDFSDFQNFAGDPNYWASEVYTKLTCDLYLDPAQPGRQTYKTAVIASDEDNSNNYFDGTPFSGHFMGNGCRIFNVRIDTDGVRSDYLGLFGYIYGGTVSHLGIENSSVEGYDASSRIGPLCGGNDGTITGCYSSEGVVTGGDQSSRIGGLCGENSGTIISCYSTGSVNGSDTSWSLGGLCGQNNHYSIIASCFSMARLTMGRHGLGGLCGMNWGTINSCYATGSISGSNHPWSLGGLCGQNHGQISYCNSRGNVIGDDMSQDLGGLCGNNNNGTITNSCSTGNVTGGGESFVLGGLCGWNGQSDITNCYATGNVTSGNSAMRLGGLCGWIGFTNITNCYSAGSVTGGDGSSYIGGLCGDRLRGTIKKSFWDVDTSGLGVAGDDNYGAVGKTSDQMQNITTYTEAGWDFVNESSNGTKDIWQILPGQYPTHKPLFSGGFGAVSDPYRLVVTADLIHLSEHSEYWDRHFILASDMDLENYSFTHAVIAPNDCPSFCGFFDGNYHCIRNLRIIGPNTNYVGLFGQTDVHTVVQNLTLVNSQIEGALYTGALVGKNHGQIRNCCSTGTVSGTNNDVGGLIGKNIGSIRDSYSWIDVNGISFVGGLVGENQAEIYHCYSTGTIDGVNWYDGLVGFDDGTITDSRWHDPTLTLDVTTLGWDYESIWCQGPDVKPYPIFQWQQVNVPYCLDPLFQWQIETWEDFEQDFPSDRWELNPEDSDKPWMITSNDSYTGQSCAGSWTLEDDQSSILKFTRFCRKGQIRFMRKTMSPPGDKLRFYINRTTNLDWAWDGIQDWTVFCAEIEEGLHTFMWIFTRDKEPRPSVGASGAWIDDVMIVAE